MNTATKTKFTTTADDAGLRLDQIVPRHVEGLSRRKARAVIDLGGVFVDRTRVKVAGRTLRAGPGDRGRDRRRARAREGRRGRCRPSRSCTTMTRSSSSTSRPGSSPRRRRRAIAATCSICSTTQFGEVYLVHRIDMPTSGLLVFARTRDANKRLGDAFKEHDVEREYRAVAIGDGHGADDRSPDRGQARGHACRAARSARRRDADLGAARDRAHASDPDPPRRARHSGRRRSRARRRDQPHVLAACAAARAARRGARLRASGRPARSVRWETPDPRRARGIGSIGCARDPALLLRQARTITHVEGRDDFAQRLRAQFAEAGVDALVGLPADHVGGEVGRVDRDHGRVARRRGTRWRRRRRRSRSSPTSRARART